MSYLGHQGSDRPIQSLSAKVFEQIGIFFQALVRLEDMGLGHAPLEEDLYRSTRGLCEKKLPELSIFRLLATRCHELFPDEAFADLFANSGRHSIPPRITAVVLILQRFTGMSDREAADTFTFDTRWKYAAGALDFDFPSFDYSVLCSMRGRLRHSTRPDRIFETVVEAAVDAGLVGRKRVLDSTALYDAVATQDTVTLIRSAIVGLLNVVDAKLEPELRTVLTRDDDYRTAGKPKCDWEDVQARESLVDELARDGQAALAVLHGQILEPCVRRAAELLATVLGQDLERTEDGLFRIAQRVTPDRTISTVDPEARHGHKTASRGFDGFKGHVSIDPDSEIIVATEVTAGNVADGDVAKDLLAEALATAPDPDANPEAEENKPIEIYGDSSYGTAELVEHIEAAGAEANVKVQPPAHQLGMFSQDAFSIDLRAGTATCPQGIAVVLQANRDGSSRASFGSNCAFCPQRSKCTRATGGRMLRIHPKHETLARSRVRQRDPSWRQRYRATRPKVERKLAHLIRHGGRRARVRGRERIGQDFMHLAAAVNLARLASLACLSSSAR